MRRQSASPSRDFPAMIGVAAAALMLLLVSSVIAQAQAIPQWAGDGRFRILVEVAPMNLGTRTMDERPAQVSTNVQAELLSHFGIQAKADMRSVQIIRYDSATGLPVNDGNWAFGSTPADRPFRWYDDSIPSSYSEFEGYLSNTTNGTISWTNHERWGYFYDTEGNWSSGKFAFTHTQQGNQPSYYAIYFNDISAASTPWQASPRGWLGDGGMRTAQISSWTTGTIDTRTDASDWDGDGLDDIIAGSTRGGMAWYKNTGTAASPQYGTSKLLYTTDGRPIDVGWNSAPKVVDWDGDGDDDIISGGNHNRVAWYKNVGSNANRQFVYQGTVKDFSGQNLALPTTPNPEIPSITQDYYPVLDVVDIDGDGRRDLIAGGYITGRLYFYKNMGANANGTPQLQLQGPLTAGGQPIDTQWAAAPTFADFNSDGRMDFVTGTFYITGGVTPQRFLQYYENVGTPTAPAFEQRTILGALDFPAAALGTPRATDFNHDGLLDLIVSTDTQIYKYPNTGTATSPRWTTRQVPLPSEWGSSPLFATQLIDWNGDGQLDRLQDLAVSLNLAQGNPGVYGPASSILPAGQSIPPKPGTGDGWQNLRVFDLDWNDQLDVMDADHDGKIWLHRNLGTTANPNFDAVGKVLMQLDGNPIDVGPGPSDPAFDQLQGSRARYAVADFNNNGRPDLVVVNFNGTVRYYENEMASSAADPLFTLPTVVGTLTTRGTPFAGDWDHDGLIDILASSSPDKLLFVRNVGVDGGGRSLFAPGVYIDLVAAPYDSVGLLVTDFNGDGDDDVIVDTSHRYTTWTDGSFLQNGYASSTVLRWEANAGPGDLNFDGVVNIFDINIVSAHWGSNDTVADPNHDGIVDIFDINLISQNWSISAETVVPEPGTLCLTLCLLIGLPLVGRRRGSPTASADAGPLPVPRRPIPPLIIRQLAARFNDWVQGCKLKSTAGSTASGLRRCNP